MDGHARAAPAGLDPRMWAILQEHPSLETFDPAAMRDHARISKARWNAGAAEGLVIRDNTHPARGGPRPIRCLAPSPAPARPDGAHGPIVHVHGGGWTTCDADTHLSILARIAQATGRIVLAPHARLAPEAPYPKPLEDTVDALRHVARLHPGGYDLSADSAGANLALAALLWLRDQEEAVPVRAIALHYGCFRRRFDTASHRLFGDGRYGLSTEKMRIFWDLYMQQGVDSGYGDLTGTAMHGLPPMQIHVADADILRDDSLWLADRVGAAGGAVDCVRWPGMAHGFLHYPGDLSEARDLPLRMGQHFETFGGAAR